MSDKFLVSFEKMIQNEGGYKLHTVEGDSGGMTYAGIARNYHSEWNGWKLIDLGMFSEDLTNSVRIFYKENFWDRMKCELIENDQISSSIFDFSVNTGTRTCSKIVQLVVGATPDGVIGNKTLASINAYDPALFISNFCIAKISRYATICNNNRTQDKFLLGWLNRSLKEVV